MHATLIASQFGRSTGLTFLMEKQPQTFREWFRSLREAKGISVRQAAAQAEVSPSAISLMEDGKRPATRKMVTKLAKALEFDLNFGLLLAGFQPETKADDEQQSAHGYRVITVRLINGKSVRATVPPEFDEADLTTLRSLIEAGLRARGHQISGDSSENE
jgi:transcriptional regulator with XRE-family HTH domain